MNQYGIRFHDTWRERRELPTVPQLLGSAALIVLIVWAAALALGLAHQVTP